MNKEEILEKSRKENRNKDIYKRTLSNRESFIRGDSDLNEKLILKNHLKDARAEKRLSQAQLAEMVGVSRNTISSIETGQFNPTAKLALILCIALDKKFEDLFYF